MCNGEKLRDRNKSNFKLRDQIEFELYTYHTVI